jgi:hypothetical protein
MILAGQTAHFTVSYDDSITLAFGKRKLVTNHLPEVQLFALFLNQNPHFGGSKVGGL